MSESVRFCDGHSVGRHPTGWWNWYGVKSLHLNGLQNRNPRIRDKKVIFQSDTRFHNDHYSLEDRILLQRYWKHVKGLFSLSLRGVEWYEQSKQKSIKFDISLTKVTTTTLDRPERREKITSQSTCIKGEKDVRLK